MSRLASWYPFATPALVVSTDPDSDDGWDELREKYTPQRRNRPFERIISIAQEHGVRSVLIEPRYVDPHYRSEHSRFYSSTFQRYPSICHRLHFFTQAVPEDLSRLGELQDAYRGYSVIRPVPTSPVGRTMIAPPPSLRDAFLCLAKDEVHPFGAHLSVEAAPFMSQDEQYLRCAHAAQWMVLYHTYLCHSLPRRLPGDIHDASMGGLVVGRQLPSEGLSAAQMLTGLQALQLSAGQIELPLSREVSKARGITSLYAILCRYVNSQMPPIVISYKHAWVVVGYKKRTLGSGHDSIVLYRNDDAIGPYIEVLDPWDESHHAHRPWLVAMPPLPARLYLTAERAELIGRFWMEHAESEGSALLDAVRGRTLTFRCFAVRSHDFKERLAGRLPDEVARLYREAHLPGYIWVVEVLDRDLMDQRQPSVLGEVIIDATAHHLTWPDDPTIPVVLGFHLLGKAWIQDPDHLTLYRVGVPDNAPYPSGCPVDPLTG